MKKSIGLHVILIFAVGTQGYAQKKRISKISGMPYDTEVVFKYNANNQVINITKTEKLYNSNKIIADVYTFKYDKEGRVSERKLNSENGAVKIDFYIDRKLNFF